MALTKTVSFKGHDYSYWKIRSFEVDVVGKKIEGFICLFKDRAQYLENPNHHIQRRMFKMDISTQLAAVSAMTVLELFNALYAQLKSGCFQQYHVSDVNGVPLYDGEGDPHWDFDMSDFFNDATDAPE
jgi:hypothetical protein